MGWALESDNFVSNLCLAPPTLCSSAQSLASPDLSAHHSDYSANNLQLTRPLGGERGMPHLCSPTWRRNQHGPGSTFLRYLPPVVLGQLPFPCWVAASLSTAWL